MQDNEKYNDNRNMFIRALLGIPPKRPKQTKKERNENNESKKISGQQQAKKIVDGTRSSRNKR
jgi:hypothetical protein